MIAVHVRRSSVLMQRAGHGGSPVLLLLLLLLVMREAKAFPLDSVGVEVVDGRESHAARQD